MPGFWKKWMARRTEAAEERAEQAKLETPEERRIYDEGPVGLGADERVETQLGQSDPNRLVDDEFKP